jgi:NAD(P)-dependent dehydrogenase (short-subunit alcohol dehydrogenase family)
MTLRFAAVPWTTADVPDLHGSTAVVTGANSGIGLETAAVLAAHGATTVLACRNEEKADAARAQIERRSPSARVEFVRLDLSSQGQIADAAAELIERFPRVDRLINNAGVMGVPLDHTPDGHEVVFGTNHLGHFAWTGRVLPAVLASPCARVVTVSSLSHRWGRIPWDDLRAERGGYSRSAAYARSKLANALFFLELQRRFAAAGSTAGSLGSHPGFANTEIARHQLKGAIVEQLRARVGDRLAQSPAHAALPTLRAATDPGAFGGQYYGPANLFGAKGPPVACSPARRALDEGQQRRLWERSVELTGVEFPIPAPPRRGAGDR